MMWANFKVDGLIIELILAIIYRLIVFGLIFFLMFIIYKVNLYISVGISITITQIFVMLKPWFVEKYLKLFSRYNIR